MQGFWRKQPVLVLKKSLLRHGRFWLCGVRSDRWDSRLFGSVARSISNECFQTLKQRRNLFVGIFVCFKLEGDKSLVTALTEQSDEAG